MAKKRGYSLQLIDTLYEYIPAFTDVFDEETWYPFVLLVVMGTILGAFIISRFVTIRSVE